MQLAALDPGRQAALSLFLGATGLMLSVFLIARAIVGSHDVSPGRRGLAHWLPVVVTALIAVVMGQPTMAVAIVFGTSVALLSSVAGFVMLMAPVQDEKARQRSVWMFLPVAALLAFFVGFRGKLGFGDAILLTSQGAILLWLWLDPALRYDERFIVMPPGRVIWSARVRSILAAAAIVLAGGAAVLAIHGGVQLSHLDERYPTGTIAAVILGMALAMPMISTAAPAVNVGRMWDALTGQATVVLLNLCALLPLIVVLPMAIRWVHLLGQLSTATTTPVESTPDIARVAVPTIFPLAVWRIDAVLLIILSVTFVPLAMGRVRPNRLVGLCLVAVYAVYLLAVVLLGAAA